MRKKKTHNKQSPTVVGDDVHLRGVTKDLNKQIEGRDEHEHHSQESKEEEVERESVDEWGGWRQRKEWEEKAWVSGVDGD